MDNNINSSLSAAPLQTSTQPTTDILAPAGGHLAVILSIVVNVIVIAALSFMIYYFGIPTMDDKLMMAESQKQSEMIALNKTIKDLENRNNKMEKEKSDKAEADRVIEYNKMQSINASTTDTMSSSTKVLSSSTLHTTIKSATKPMVK